jgi:uncharacterized protein (TIGR02452 family)
MEAIKTTKLSTAQKRRLRAKKNFTNINDINSSITKVKVDEIENKDDSIMNYCESPHSRLKYSRSEYKQWAQRAVKISNHGEYHAPSGKLILIRKLLDSCLSKTYYYSPENPIDVDDDYYSYDKKCETLLELTFESALEAAERLNSSKSAAKIVILNFASAHNPGGGFLNGSAAQEESSARSSALYACLTETKAGSSFYQLHSKIKSTFYSNALVYAEQVPVFATNDGSTLLEQPFQVDFVSIAAVNCLGGKISPESNPVKDVMRIRILRVLNACLKHGATHLILGAWGTGVFSQSPKVIGKLFAECLQLDKYKYGFQHIVFALHSDTDSTREFKLQFFSKPPTTITNKPITSNVVGTTSTSDNQDNQDHQQDQESKSTILNKLQKPIVVDKDGYWSIKNIIQNMNIKKGARNIILILSGSLNPIHYGHVMMLEEARKYLESLSLKQHHFNVLGMVLAPSSDGYVSKKLGKEAITLEKRCQLCQLAIESKTSMISDTSLKLFQVCDWGIASAEKLMDSIETEFKNAYQDQDDFNIEIEIGMVAGADDMVKRAIWNKDHLIPKNRVLIAIGRGNIPITTKPNKYKFVIQSDLVPKTSSTIIRQAKTQGKIALDQLVKDNVLPSLVANVLL